MAAPKQTKKQRIEEAREAARLAREKREKRQRMLRILIPTLVSVGVLAIVAVVIVVIAIQPKPVAAGAAPKNMASFGVQLSGSGGDVKVTKTAARKASAGPASSTVGATDAKYHIVEYLDLSCPVCKEFEGNTSAYVDKLVASGDATLELKPIAILDRLYSGTKYSTRINTAGACVANFAPDKFRDFATAAYDKQPDENSSGLTNAQIVSLAHDAGISNASIDACITKQNYASWMTGITNNALNDQSVQGTPTVLINKQPADLGQYTLAEFKTALAAAA